VFRRQGIDAGNQECAAHGDALVAGARVVVGQVTKFNYPFPEKKDGRANLYRKTEINALHRLRRNLSGVLGAEDRRVRHSRTIDLLVQGCRLVTNLLRPVFRASSFRP
jgi:hypothetical protein